LLETKQPRDIRFLARDLNPGLLTHVTEKQKKKYVIQMQQYGIERDIDRDYVI